MKFFLDTANLDELRAGVRWGIIDGVTTNPSLIAKEGVPLADQIRRICDIVDGDVSAEVIATEADEMLKQGRELARIHKNVVVKVPLMCEGLIAVKQLSGMGIKTNVTVTFSPLQAMLAAKCGATYISPFVGRLDAVGHIGMDLARQIKTIYDHYGFATKLLVAAVRHPEHVLQAALIGAPVCTMSFDVMKQLYDHPLTDIGIDMFLKDWAKVPK